VLVMRIGVVEQRLQLIEGEIGALPSSPAGDKACDV
jgi:hypothetical protein